MCMVNTILELEKNANKKEKGSKSGWAFFPKKIVVGNKKDLRKNAEIGLIDKDDVKELVNKKIRVKEVSALTNQGVSEAFKLLVS